MGKTKPNPRYNVLSLRVSDDELRQIEERINNNVMASRQEFLHQAIIEKLRKPHAR